VKIQTTPPDHITFPPEISPQNDGKANAYQQGFPDFLFHFLSVFECSYGKNTVFQ
jgi:hypothetical protein